MDEVVNIIDEIKGTVITVVTDRGKKTFDIGKLFLIDEDNLTREFVQQAAFYAFFSVLIATAERNVAKRDLLKDQEYSAADESYRKELTDKAEKYTETVIKSMVLRDEDYQTTMEELESARYDLNLLKAITRAYEHKGNMLQSLGSHLRHEYSMMGMHVNEAEVVDAVKAVKENITKRRKIDNQQV
jgi:hypothetical protein